MNRSDLMCKTGDGVRIAIIDSGVALHHPFLKNATIQQYRIDDTNNNLFIPTELCDPFGHGTACAGIIHKYARKAIIYALQCFDKNGISTETYIVKALKWCLDNNVNIINLSFGAISEQDSVEIKKIGKKCADAGILIFTSCHDTGYMAIPARYPSFIPVIGKTIKERYDYYYIDDRFVAHGGRQIVCWNNNSYIYADGSSFATARISGIAAKIIEVYPDLSVDKYIEILKQYAIKSPSNILSLHRDIIYESNSVKFDMKNVAIYSNTKEIQTMLNFKEMLPFNIVAIINPPKMLYTESLKTPNIPVYKKLDDLKKHQIDTIIISRTSSYENLVAKNVTEYVIQWALENDVNIYSLEYIDKIMYPKYFEIAQKKKLKIRHPIHGEEDYLRSKIYRDLYGHISNSTPIVGVFGTGTSQGKFTVQLMLRKLFSEKGYNVCNFGTETHSELFGFEGVCPLEMNSSIRFSRDQIIKYIQGEIRRIEITLKPDILFVGSQSGVVPYSYFINDDEYTLPTIAFLMATVPHICILCINITDDRTYIRNTIEVLESLGKGKVIALVASKIYRKIENSGNIIKKEFITDEEFEDVKNEIFELFGIPLYDIMETSNSNLLANDIIKYFKST